VLFGDIPTPSPTPTVTVNVNGAGKTLRALWFNAGNWYTLSGAQLTLGSGLASGDAVVTVNADASGMSENNINNTVRFNFGAVTGPSSARFLEITNHSEGGLRFGGPVSFMNGDFQGGSFLRVGGHGATHFANSISGKGFLFTKNNQTTHLVLSGNNANWQGVVAINPESLGFIKRNDALPGSSFGAVHAGVSSGGTLGFRSHGHGPALNYSSAHTISVQGQGAVRQWGQPPVGALYHDGGTNTFAGNITMAGDTWFGARGDRGGSLTLTGTISGGSYTFTKVGPGLITLTNTANTWGNTHLNGGVLRLNVWNVIPASSNFVFNGGILELKAQPSIYRYGLGTGGLQVQWQQLQGGSGGFSAYGTGIANLRIAPSNIGPAPELIFGENGFVPIGKELLLSSRYATARIHLQNNIRAAGAAIRVERGLNADAYASTGNLTSDPNMVSTGAFFTKTGPGLLMIGSGSAYSAQTRIMEGALGGTIHNNSNIRLQGGVLMLNNGANFIRDLGTGANQVQWWGAGGFAAFTGDATVKIGNSTSVLNWDSLYFSQYSILKFGHYTASGTVIWNRPLQGGATRTRTISIERGRGSNRADVVFNKTLSMGAGIKIEGDGRMDSQDMIKTTLVYLSGAELRLNKGGYLSGSFVDIEKGGTLTLDNRGTYKSVTGGQLLTRLPDTPLIDLNDGASFRLWGAASGSSIIEDIRHFQFSNGATNIDVRNNSNSSYTQIKLRSIVRDSEENKNEPGLIFSYNTLNLTSNVPFSDGETNGTVSIKLTHWGEQIYVGFPPPPKKWHFAWHEINDFDPSQKIIPWATVNSIDWVHPKHVGNYTYLISLPIYYTGSANNWSSEHNVSVNQNTSVAGKKSINSLRLIGQFDLSLDQSDLMILSGGLLSYGQTRIRGLGDLSSPSPRTFYAHISGNMLIEGRVRFNVGEYMHFVKTGSGTLVLNSNLTHNLNLFAIHEGTVSLISGRISYQEIQIGDYSGTSVLELPANTWNPLNPLPEAVILMQGPKHGILPEYGGHAAILRLGGNTKQHLHRLTIMNGNSVIDWVGGEVGKANILWIDELEIDGGSRLLMRNWYQYEDLFLVGKNFNPKFAPLIVFEGYEDFPVLAIDYDSNYWQITPFLAPEPSTYGAIMGGAGLALWAWRRRRVASATHASATLRSTQDTLPE